MKLDARAFGLACGVILALAGSIGTLLSLQYGAGRTIGALGAVYLGYSRTYVGALVALFWGLAYGFVGGWLLAVVYNRVAGRSPTE